MRSHGLVATYANGGCRCELCKVAYATYQRQRRIRRKERSRLRPFTSGRPQTQDFMQWADHAACRTLPKAVFFPVEGGRRNYDQAKAICASCPVRVECLQYALRTQQPDGCWGGMAPEERWRTG